MIDYSAIVIMWRGQLWLRKNNTDRDILFLGKLFPKDKEVEIKSGVLRFENNKKERVNDTKSIGHQ